MLLSEKDIRRFWSKVDIKAADECWPWIPKSRTDAGYGLFNIWVDDTRRSNFAASRISCFLEHGPLPYKGARSLHSCDNPPCCNPKHLRWGTQRDNVKDAQERGRHVDPPRFWDNPEWAARHRATKLKGVDAPDSSLNESQVREIWRRWLEGEGPTPISKIMNIPHHVVFDVCRGRSYRELDGAPSVEELMAVRKPAGNPSLREEQVRDIWQSFLSGKSSAHIARDIGASPLVVYDVCRGRSWRHLPDAPPVEALKKGGKRRGFNQFG